MSNLKPLALVRDITGKTVHLGLFESVAGIHQEPDGISLTINTARVKSSYLGDTITHRGMCLYRFIRDARTDTWSLAFTIPTWWSVEEIHSRRVRDEASTTTLDAPTVVPASRRRGNGYRGEASR